MKEFSPRYLRAFAIVVAHEGGFVNNAADPGGATQWGISLRYARSKGLLYDIDGDGDVDVDDIRRVTQDTARRAFWEDFWRPVRADEMPAELSLLLFDASVNSGPVAAIKMLQRAISTRPDGILGPITISYAQHARAPELFQRKRLDYMQAATDTKGRALWPSFGKGWSDRVLQLSYQARSFAADDAATVAEQGAML